MDPALQSVEEAVTRTCVVGMISHAKDRSEDFARAIQPCYVSLGWKWHSPLSPSQGGEVPSVAAISLVVRSILDAILKEYDANPKQPLIGEETGGLCVSLNMPQFGTPSVEVGFRADFCVYASEYESCFPGMVEKGS